MLLAVKIRTWLIVPNLLLLTWKNGLCQNVMKAAVLHSFGPDKLFRIQNDVPIPSFSESQMLVKVKATGINPVDMNIRAGVYEDEKPNLPAILGNEISGVVENVGVKVSKFKKNDKVYCRVDSGGYAEFVAANASYCFPLEDRLTFSRGAALYITYFAAFKALVKNGNLKKEEIVLVHDASGGLGTASVQVAHCIGALIFATVSTQAVRNIVTKAGASVIANHTEYTYLHPTLYERNMLGFDVILEVMKNPKLKRDQFYLKPNGRLVVLTENKTISLTQDDMPLDKRLYSVSLIPDDDEETEQEAAEFVSKCVTNGKITPFIAHEYTLDAINEAYDHITNSKEEEKGKRVIVL